MRSSPCTSANRELAPMLAPSPSIGVRRLLPHLSSIPTGRFAKAPYDRCLGDWGFGIAFSSPAMACFQSVGTVCDIARQESFAEKGTLSMAWYHRALPIRLVLVLALLSLFT